jgi:glycine/D-amino acid oxidase-like deaminating enzyme/nitrite reductase/ring-hydroxylating ferredoxin subunit
MPFMKLNQYPGTIFSANNINGFMKRDGACISLWQDTVPDFIPQAKAKTDRRFDVVIVGGGLTGVTTGLLLQKKGLNCLIAEAHNICFGTTGGTTAHLNTFFDNPYDQVKTDFGEDNAQLVAKATKQSLALFQEHIEEYAIDCNYEKKDGFLFAQTDEQVEKLQKIYEASKEAGVKVAHADGIPVPIEYKKAIVYADQAQLHPSRYVHALAKEFEKAGGIILQNCIIDKFDEQDGILTIESNQGTVKANHLIYATHIPPGVNILHFRCAPYRSYAMAVSLKDNNYPEGLAYDMYDPYHYYRTQVVDGKKYLIAGGEDHKTAHLQNTESCFTHLESHIRKYYNVDEIAFKWSSQYFEPADGLAYIGHLPGNPENVYVATGYGGNGITYSHIAAIALTNLITSGESDFVKLFNPGRVKPVAGFSSFIKENVDVVKEFFKKRFSVSGLKEVADIAPGEARLIKYEGESIALYKDMNGKLHAIDPVCPHAKCLVDWNSAEKSWDCPCHGSRFSYDGELLTGPSRHGLELIEISELVKEP